MSFSFCIFVQVSQSPLRELLLQCCMDDAYDVRQSAFALLGDLARVSRCLWLGSSAHQLGKAQYFEI